MNDLIRLTGQEIAVAHIELTLYDIAKRFGKDKGKDWHRDLVRAFMEDYNRLSTDEKLLLGNFSELQIKVSRGNRGGTQLIPTIKMNVKMAVWFISRFEPRLRARIVDFAFKQLENDYYKAQKKIQQLEADKFIEYDDGYHSMSRIVKKNFPDLTTTQVFDLLDELGYIETKEYRTIKREPINLDVKHIGHKVIKYNEEEIVEIVKKELKGE